eukprot:s66_g12.t1
MLRTGELLGLRAKDVTVDLHHGHAVIALGLTKGGKRTGAAESVTVTVHEVIRSSKGRGGFTKEAGGIDAESGMPQPVSLELNMDHRVVPIGSDRVSLDTHWCQIVAHVGPVKRTKHFFNFRREQTLDDDLLSDSTMSESYVSSSASGPYSRQGSAPDAEEEQTGDFSQTLGAALSKFGCAQSSCETTSCGSAQPVEPQGAPRPAAVSLSEVSHDGASSQGWVSVHDASVLAGKTTVMVKNVPVKYTQRKLLREFLSAGFHGKMDFIYLPIDPRSRCSRGFAFCNFSSPEVTQEFFSTFHKKFLNSYDSEVPLEVAAAEIQGFEANAEHYLVVKGSPAVHLQDFQSGPLLDFTRGYISQKYTMETQEEEYQKVCQVLQRTQAVVTRAGFEGEVVTFGSSATGFKSSGSDVDVAYTGHVKDRSPAGQVKELSQLVRHLKEEFQDVTPVFGSKIPVVKFHDPVTDLEVDFCIKNDLGIRNSQLLDAYCRCDPRVPVLGKLVKEWTKTHELVGVPDGCLNSYAYMIMMIHYLQSLYPPVVVNLQELATEPHMVKDAKWGVDVQWDTKFLNEVEMLQPSDNRMSNAELLFGFFTFFGRQFDWSQYAVCIRCNGSGRSINKFSLQHKFSDPEQWYIEDPFDLRHNLASGCSAAGRRRILKAMHVATSNLLSAKLKEVCGPSDERRSYFLKCKVDSTVTAEVMEGIFQQCDLVRIHLPVLQGPQCGQDLNLRKAVSVPRDNNKKTHGKPEGSIVRRAAMPPSTWGEVNPQERSIELEPAMPQTALPVNPGKLLKMGSGPTELSGVAEMLTVLHAEMLQRFDQQDQVLQQLTTAAATQAGAKKSLIPVAAVQSMSEGSSASVGCSDASGGSHEPQPLRKKKNDKKKPTLFSTFTQFDLSNWNRAMDAEETVYQSEDPSSVHKVGWAKTIVDDSRFDIFFAFVVITNSIFIGVDVQMNPSSYGSRPIWIHVLQIFYTVLFSIELAFRVAANGKNYFCSQEWAWAVLDLFIVVSSWWEVFVEAWYASAGDDGSFDSFGGLTGLKAFRIVRLTRIVKTVRLMRIFRFVLALRTLIHSILHTLKSLFWALVLLALIVYVFALIFTQAVADHVMDPMMPDLEELDKEASKKYFGSLMETMLSLFMTISDGVSWEKIISVLSSISLVWTAFFIFYVAFTYFAVLNVLTGVFCQSAIESAQNDHATAVQSMIANKEAHLTKVRALFNQLGTDERSVITFRQFEEKINSDEVREYFETLGLDEATLLWDISSSAPLPDVTYVISGAITCPDNILMDIEVPASAIVMPQLQDSVLPVKVIEFFSGGLGGWKTACSFLSSSENIACKVLAIEWDLDAAWAYSVSHGVPLINGRKRLDPCLALKHDHLVVHTDVAGDSWLSLGSAWQPDIVTISSPCPPWSAAGSASGLNSEEGQLLIRAIAVCKMLRPRIIALEQVSAVTNHEHFKFVMRTLSWAGYNLLHAQISDASDIMPIARARWLAYAVRVSDAGVTQTPFQSWIPKPLCVPNMWNAILPDEWLQDPRLFPQSHVLSLSARHDLLPPAKRRIVTKDQVLASRCYDGSTKLPTLVASYGSQHRFSEAWLSERGLLNHFFRRSHQQPRYWHPVELWLLHATHGKQFFLEEWEQSYKHIGNQICPAHALLILVNAMNCLHKVPQKLETPEVIEKFIQTRNTATSIHLIHTTEGILACPLDHNLTDVQKHNLETFRTNLCHGTVPDDQVWTIDGFVKCHTDEHANTNIEPTMPFAVFRTVQMCTQGLSFQVQIQHGIPAEAVLQVWDHAFHALECFDTLTDDADTLVSRDHWQKSADPMPKLWVIIHNHTMYIAEPGFSLENIPQMKISIARLLLASSKCHVHTVNDQTSFRFAIHLTGDTNQLQALETFWTGLFSKHELDQLGLVLKVCRTKGITILSWEVACLTCPMPLHLFCHTMFLRALRMIFNGLQEPTGTLCRIKIFGQSICELSLLRHLSIESLKQCVHAVSPILVDDSQFRLIHEGMQPAPETPIGSLKLNSRNHLALHFVLQLQGGGENGTKTAHRTQIKNAIAGVLLEEGHELSWTTKSVEQLMTMVGTKELSPILTQHSNAKLQTALDFLKKCNIDIPRINTAKFSQAAAQVKKKRQAMMPDPANYTVIEGTLTYENDMPCAHIQKFGGHMQGYHMCTPSAALPWLRQGELLSKDELALLVFGDLPITTRLPCEHVTVPCIDERGRQVLIAGVLVQCGDKKVKITKGDGHKVATDNTILVAVTWRKQDWPDHWTEICNNPYKAIRTFPGASEILVSVWGKSYRQGKSQATPHTANSVQVHCLFKEDKFPPFLKLSGYNLLWLSPKTSEGKPHPNWRIIWLDASADMQTATALTAKIQESAGLVCQSQRLAIRVNKGGYDDAWKTIFPSTPIPEEIDTSRVWKIESLPFGVTSTMIQAWAQHVGWKLKPLRAVGPRAWLIGTGAEPPAGQLHFNSSPILARELKARFQPSNGPIVAGPRPTKHGGNQSGANDHPLPAGDPWANYSGPRPSMPVAQPSVAQIGPTEQQFAQQTDRLNKLEDAMKQLNTGQQKQGILIDKMQKEQHGRDQEIRQHIDDKFSAIKVDIDRTLAGALQQQANQFTSSMEEIKSMLRDRPKRKSKTTDDEDMED